MGKNPVTPAEFKFINGFGLIQSDPYCPKCGRAMQHDSRSLKKPLGYTLQRSNKYPEKLKQPFFKCTNRRCGYRTQDPKIKLTEGEVKNRKKSIAISARQLAITTYQKLIADYPEIDDSIRAKCLARANKIAVNYYNTQVKVFCDGV